MEKTFLDLFNKLSELNESISSNDIRVTKGNNVEWYDKEYFFNETLSNVRFNLKRKGITVRLPAVVKQAMLDKYEVSEAYYDYGELCWEDNFAELWNKIAVKEVKELKNYKLEDY